MLDPDSDTHRQSNVSSSSRSDLPVSFSETDEILNPDPAGATVTWEHYEAVRCSLAHVCTRFGSIGPGFNDDALDAYTVDDPDYWIVGDQYNEQDKFVYVSPTRRAMLTVEWICKIAMMLESIDGWAVSVGFEDGFFIVYADRIIAGGEMFRGCSTHQTLVEAAHTADTWD